MTTGELAGLHKGSTAAAKVSSANAEDLAIGGYYGWVLGDSSVYPPGANRQAAARTVPPLTRALSRALRGALAEGLRGAGAGGSGTRVLAKTTTPGTCGGQVTIDATPDSATGRYSGTMVYEGYCYDGVVFQGTVYVEGQPATAGNPVETATYWFRSLSLTSDGSLRLYGLVSETYNDTTFQGDERMDLIIEDPDSKATAWLEGYHVTYSESGSTTELQMTGRYHDPEYGYVDLSTESPLVGNIYSDYYTAGALVFRGADKTWVKLFFYNSGDHMYLSVDSDGDGVADWGDGPPTANAGLDQTAYLGAQVSLDGSGSRSMDGSTLSYSWTLNEYPGGSYPVLSGADTSTPTFTPWAAGTYVFSLTVKDVHGYGPPDTVTVNVTRPTPSDPTLLSRVWRSELFGSDVGSSGVAVVDLDGDGKMEIVVATVPYGAWSSGFWYVVKSVGVGEYRQTWMGEMYAKRVTRIVAEDADGDGKPEVYVGLEDGSVIVYEGRSLAEKGRFSSSAPVQDIAVADLNGDDVKEILTTDGSTLRAHSSADFGLLWTSGYGGSSIAVGNVDQDDAPEIVVAGSSHGYVLDSATRAIKWDYPNGFGRIVRVGDVNGDGAAEIVAANSWYKVTAFDARIDTPLWEISTSSDIASMRLWDVDGDGVFEILYGEAQWGGVHCYDGKTRSERWSTGYTGREFNDIAIADLDGTGGKELIWAGEDLSAYVVQLHVADLGTREVQWRSPAAVGPFSADAGDLSGGGTLSVVSVSDGSQGGYGAGTIVVWNGVTHDPLWERDDLTGISAWSSGVSSVQVADVDGDGRGEIVLTIPDLHDGVLQVYDGVSGALERQSPSYSGESFSALAAGDVNGDGKTEVVVGARSQTGPYLIVFDGASASEVWKSVALVSGWGTVSDVALGDADGDGHVEIVAAVADSQVHVYDGVTHQLDWLGTVEARSVAVADVDGDGQAEIVVGTPDGYVEVYDGSSHELKTGQYTYSATAIDAVAVEDIDGDGSPELLLCSDGHLLVFSLPGMTLLYESPNLGANLALHGQLRVRDIDGDGHKEVLLGSDLGVFEFRVR